MYPKMVYIYTFQNNIQQNKDWNPDKMREPFQAELTSRITSNKIRIETQHLQVVVLIQENLPE